MSFSKKASLFVSIAALAAGIVACGSNNSATNIRLSGAGASFPSKIYTRWFADLNNEGGPRVNYQAVGSGSGRKAFIDETVDFGASDDPMKAQDIAKVKRGLVQIPMVGGTVAFGYNNPDCELKLTQRQAVRIAIGKINNWSELGCPAQKITWIHRSDGSGTTKAFTNSMEAFSKEWTLGTGKSVAWPVGIGGKGNAGVAGVIKNTPGAIGYVNQSYIKGNVRAAALQNLSGEFLKPNINSGAKALNGITLDPNLAGSNPNPTAKGAYPIATLTWVLAYETGNGSKTEAIIASLGYLLSDKAQAKAPSLGFVPLTGDILMKARKAVTRIGK
ncbi:MULTISPECIES: phosphate ABC transporter substrate-binding protein PstS [Prochlorococcus]|uniref:Phosphate-binding protein n=1 Tax=Prochlorococcus marinus (strain SARG / CCMP1375 / SS120) TaxID=167539 RepID=Q7VAD1_PROMA|nr:MULTISPECIES: phosphate ABC transporter substrate-binding protein PstS [Prochlorococcus]AAQ00577.1 ABC-type phosphate transport system periplasmic component [Prochlorococcus marinus subsp. marinus str. CCMP1375]KGG10935.1 Phosphate ABC transporter [Prochlorococcus marinus str. LG]KGG20519.1 Phosphate ABC transporter [Prochlorococcus marinus str. SS2]KGG24184.1 Phosphate ABC transporter [Prochlorococcus marinus str. SS35]KGG31558.1 Phosphate ABC transporter [Prochlorococcus marinus str. SS51